MIDIGSRRRGTRGLTAAILAATLLAAGSATPLTPAPVVQAGSGTPISVSVVVPAVQWTSTGLSVGQGDQLTISATGSWTPGPGYGTFGPDGRSGPWGDNFLNLADIGRCASCYDSAPAGHWAALIGYIGNDPPPAGSYANTTAWLQEAQKVFFVGSKLSMTSSLTGTLWLAFNDDAYSDVTGDNAGQVTASIAISSSQSGASATGYAQGQAIARYDTMSGWSGASAKYNGPFYARYNPTLDTGITSIFGLEYQCVELVQRYFYLKHWVTLPVWRNWHRDAYQMPTNLPMDKNGRPEAIYEQQAKRPTEPPKPGDILVFSQTTNWPTGHVALITSVSSTTVTFIQQNITATGQDGGPPVARDQLDLKKTGSGSTATYSVASRSSRVAYPPVLGWIHAKVNNRPVPPPAVVVAPVAPTGSLPPGTYTLNLRLQGGEDQVTLTTADVDAAGRIRLWFVYVNTGSSTWGLYCPADPQVIHLTLSTGMTVAPLDTYCSHHVGEDWFLPPGGTIKIWGLFPTIADRSQPFSLNWYEWNAPTVIVRR